jgi:hypothetical protein
MNILPLNETEFKNAFYEKMNELSNNDKNKLKSYILRSYDGGRMLVNKQGKSKLKYDAYNAYDCWLQSDVIYDFYDYDFSQDIIAELVSEKYDIDVKYHNFNNIKKDANYELTMDEFVIDFINNFKENDTLWFEEY